VVGDSSQPPPPQGGGHPFGFGHSRLCFFFTTRSLITANKVGCELFFGTGGGGVYIGGFFGGLMGFHFFMPLWRAPGLACQVVCWGKEISPNPKKKNNLFLLFVCGFFNTPLVVGGGFFGFFFQPLFFFRPFCCCECAGFLFCLPNFWVTWGSFPLTPGGGLGCWSCTLLWVFGW